MKEKQVQPLEQLYKKLQEDNIKVPDNFLSFASNLDDSQKASQLHQFLVGKNYDVPEDYEKFSKVLNIGQDLKKKESTSPDSGLTSSPNLVDASSSEIGGDSTTVNPDSGNLGSLLDVDPTASEIGTPEKTNNPAKSFGKSFWKSMAYDMPSGLAGTAATAIGLGEQTLKLPEINARIHELVNKDSSLEQKAKMELGDIGKMLQKYQTGLDTGEISQDKFNELSNPLIKRANFITNNGFTDLVQDDDATKLQKSLTKWAVNRQNKGAEFTKDITNSLDQIQDPIDALNWLSSALGQSTAYIPASVVSGGATSFGVEIGSIYTDAVNRIAEREGITPEEVIDRGLDDPASAFAFGMAAGLLDKIGADEVMKIGKQSFMKSLRKRALSGGLTEAPTEAAQTILEQYGVMSSIDKKEDLNWAEIGESAAQGFVGGAGISSATEAINQTTNKTKGNESTRTLSDDSGNSTTSQNDEKSGAATSQEGSKTGQSKGSNLGNEQPQNPDQVKNEQPRDSKKANTGDAVVEQRQDGANGKKPTSQQPTTSQETAGVEGANAEKSPIKGASEQAQSGAGKVKETQKPLQSDQDNVKQTPNSLPKEGETISWKGEDGWQVGKTNTTASGKEVIELKKGDVIENVPVKDLAKNLNKPTPNLSKGPKSLTKDKKFDYEPASRQDAIAKMFGEGMRIDTKDFKSMAGNNWVKDQKSLPLNYTASEKGLKRDQLFQILDEQYPELAATTNEQDFAQEVVDFITEYPQHPGNYVDQVVAQRDKDIEYAIANEKSKAVSMVRSHSMFMDLDEADQKDFDDMSDDDVLSLYLEIEKDSESFVDKFPSTITTAEELLNEVDQYLKDPEGYFGSFMDDNLKPYAREIQQIAKSRLRGETNSTPGSQEVTPEKEASGQKKQQEVEPQNPSAFKEGDWVKSVYTGKYYEVQKTSNGVTKLKNEAGGIEEFNSNNNPHFIPDTRDTDLYGNKITPKDDKKPKQQDMFGDEPKPKGSAKQQEIDRLRKDVEAQGGQLKVNQNAKEDQGEQQPINEGIFAPKEEKGLFDDQKPMLTDEQMKAQYESDKKEITEHLGSIYIDEQGNQYEIASFKFKGWKTGQVDVEGTNGKVILSTNTSDLLDIIDGVSKAKIVKSDQPNFALPEILDTSEMRKNLSQMYRKIDDAGVQDVNTDDEIAFISKFAESKGYQGQWSRDGQGNERMYFTPIQEKPSTYGKNNKIVTEDVAAKARERLRKKLGGELRTGIDPEMMQDGILLAVYHVEAGSRQFADYSKAMIDDLGESIRPYLRSFYEGVRYYPGFTSEGMSTPEQIDQELKNQQNEPIPNPSLEPDRNDGGLENQVGQEDVQRQQPEAARPDDGGREQAPKQGRLFDQGNTGIPNDSSSPTGKRGDQGLSGEQRRGQSDTGSRDAERRALPGRPRILDGDEGQPGSHTPDPKTFTKESRLSAQKKAESITPIPNDPVNIRESLPLLYPEQQDDVIKFERRINEQPTADDPKKGMLFTNGTGTGKGFTGMGIVDRFVKQGKTNILIVTPSQDVNNTWIENAKLFNIPLMLLPDTKTKGDGVRITTYANFRANQEIKKEDFDLVIYDESQTLMDNKAAAETSTTQAHYQISNRNVAAATQRITSVHPLWIKESELWDKETELQKKWKETNSLKVKAELEDVELELRDVRREQDKLKPEIERQAKEAVERTKVVFLSATPFKAHFNLKYANGYLFDWGKETTYEKKSQGFSRVDPMGRFFLDNFGAAYEWKNNQLQSRTDSNPEAVSMQEVSFADKLMEKGAMSGRKISLEYDYSREFPLVSGFNAEMFNKAFNDIMSRMDGEFKYLSEYTKEVFGDYHYSTKLYEALRASMIIPRLEKHIDMGRKIIVFHRRHKEGSEPPFNKILNLAEEDAKLLITIGSETEKEKASATLQEIPIFRNKYKDLLEYEQTLNYKSVVNQLERHFGSETVKQINGMVSKNDRKEAIKEFNSDKSPVKIVVIHEEAGKTGISLHDQSGKHPRVLISTSLPQSTTTTLQIEGRSFRIGNQSDAIYEYPLLGLDSEIAHFANSLNKRLSTTENLSLGSQARDLLTSFSEGVANNSGVYEPHKNQGKGGKELDRRSNDTKTPFEKARLMYATNSQGRKNHLAEDFFATPEPLGQKMMDWLNLRESETALEPSAGLGAIAMWTPQYASITAIEPSFELYAKMSARVTNPNLKPIQEQFEDHNLVNKYHGIAMNPPFGNNSATAWEHTEKGLHHLKIGGRLVSILPAGPSLEKRVTKWQETNKDAEQYALRGKIKLPNVTFEQAGTKVNANVWIWDRIDPRDEDAKNLSYRELDLSFAETIDEFFDELETISFGERYASKKQQKESQDIIDRRIDDFVNGRLENRENDEGSAFIESSKHEQSGAAQKLVKLGDRVSTEDFNKYKEAARKYNGFWYRGKQAFVFQKGDIEENARQFKNFINNTETESGRKPEYQYSMARGDGRTAHQIDVASKKAGKEYFRSVMKKMRTAFPEIMFSTDKQAFENVYAMWNEGNDSIKKPNAIRWNDKIFFNPDQIYQDTPIHEFAHIWVELAKNHQGAIYKRGLQLIKDSAYHEAVKGNPFYEGQSEQAQLEEALVMAIGEKGAVLEDRNAFVKWVEKLWQRAKAFFGFTPKLDLFNVKLDEFVQKAAKELLSAQQLSTLSSLRMPETATLNLRTFKSDKTAWKDVQDRVLVDEILAETPEAWTKARLSTNRQIWEDLMANIQDETRPMKEVQREIVKNYIDNAKKSISERTDIDDKTKKRLIKQVDNNRTKIEDRLFDENDVHGNIDLRHSIVQNAREKARIVLFGRHGAATGMGSAVDALAKDVYFWKALRKGDLGKMGIEVLDENCMSWKLKEAGLTLFDLGFYSQVKHSPNYNARVREISYNRGDQEIINDGSWMTNEEAEFYMNEFKKHPEQLKVLEEQWQVLREEFVMKPLNMKLEEGMLNQEQYDNLLKGEFGETYVPLAVEFKAFSKSKFTNAVLGKGIKSIKGVGRQGKYSFEDRINPTIQLLANFDKAMADIETNKIFNQLLKIVEENPDPSYWEVHRPSFVDKMIVNKADIETMTQEMKDGTEIEKDFVALGNTKKEEIFGSGDATTIKNNSFRGFVDGKPVYIELKDERLRSVFKKMGGTSDKSSDLFMRILSGINNYYRLSLTQLNLDFALPNFVRDLEDAMINLTAYEIKGLKRKVLGNLAQSRKAIIKYEKGDYNHPLARKYADMKEAGGEIAWMNFENAEKIYRSFENEVKRFQDTSYGEQALNIAVLPIRKTMRFIILTNKVAEMSTRLAVYSSLVDMGVSKRKAALAAKNVTVNFNKKGKWGPRMTAFYLFSNPSIQGPARFLTSLAKSKKARIFAGTMTMSFYMLRYLNDYFDDDDEMKELLTSYDHENNMVIFNPMNPKLPIMIPLSPNLKPLKAIADNTYDVQTGSKSIGNATLSTLNIFAENYLPLYSQHGIPTFAQPFYEMGRNKRTYNDAPIYDERMPWDYMKKDSEMYINQPRDLSKSIADALSAYIDEQDDILEISPNTIDYTIDWGLGGMKTFFNGYGVADKLMRSKGYGNFHDWDKIPIVRRFVEDLEDTGWREKNKLFRMIDKALNEKLSRSEIIETLKYGEKTLGTEFYRHKKKIYKVQTEVFKVNSEVFNPDNW